MSAQASLICKKKRWESIPQCQTVNLEPLSITDLRNIYGYFMILPFFFFMGQDSSLPHLFSTHTSTVHCYQMGSHYHLLQEHSSLLVFHSSVLLLCQPFQSDASDCRIWSAVYIIKTHPTQTPKPPLSPAPAFALRCPNTGELCKVRGSCLQEKSHHKEGNTDRRVPALVKKR